MTVPAPRRLFRLAATAEMVTWALLLIAMILKYTGVTGAPMPVAGGLHGFVFLSYALVTTAVWVDGRWPAFRGLLGLASSVIPFATVPFERAAERGGLLHDRWLVEGRPAGDRGVLERLLHGVLRHPLPSLLIAVALVALVFTALLAAGPPTQWGR